jgi:hypothetical protein
MDTRLHSAVSALDINLISNKYYISLDKVVWHDFWPTLLSNSLWRFALRCTALHSWQECLLEQNWSREYMKSEYKMYLLKCKVYKSSVHLRCRIEVRGWLSRVWSERSNITVFTHSVLTQASPRTFMSVMTLSLIMKGTTSSMSGRR